jgi:cytochrome c oxidase assembly protein subunit 15
VPRSAVDRPTTRIFLVALLAQVGIVVTGGAVRLTGSGLGCPSWPECVPGSYTPIRHQAEGYHRYIEFGNRTLTFVLGAAVLAAIVAAWRHRRTRPPLLPLALVQLLGVVAQAVLGGITVRTGLHPATVAAHFLLSMGLIAAAVALYERGNEGDAPPLPLVPREVRWLGGALVTLAATVLTVGTVVTGSGPHAGDARVVDRFPLDPRMVSWLHADLVLLFLGLTVGLCVALRLVTVPGPAPDRGSDPATRSTTLLVVALTQAAIGYLQYFTGLPILAVALHVLGACLVWIATLRVWFALRERGDVVVGQVPAPRRAPIPAG